MITDYLTGTLHKTINILFHQHKNVTTTGMHLVCTPEFIGYCTCVEEPLWQKKKS